MIAVYLSPTAFRKRRANAPRIIISSRANENNRPMDTAALLQEIYRCYREKRLADIVELLSDDFMEQLKAFLKSVGDGAA